VNRATDVHFLFSFGLILIKQKFISFINGFPGPIFKTTLRFQKYNNLVIVDEKLKTAWF